MEIKINITINEILELLGEKTPTDMPNISKEKYLFYKTGLTIHVGDIVKVLPSENCVTDSDIITYSENMDGKTCIVKSINAFTNSVIIESDNKRYVVHNTWLELISRKIKI